VYWKRPAVLLLALAVVSLVIWGYYSARPEPVDAVTIKWSGSSHAERGSSAFRNWDRTDPPAIPPTCAKCHSTTGYLDFLGQDGTTAEKVDNPSPVGTTIECVACHNEQSVRMARVVFPSQAEITSLDGQGNCMQCHQGRASATQVEAATQGIDADAVSEKIAFISVHYRPAAATRLGAGALGGYQYPDQTYDGYYQHVRDYQQCTECHDAHSLRIDPNKCSPCHSTVTRSSGLRTIREDHTDWSGEGDTVRGVATEIEALKARLYDAIQAYAATVAGTPIVYEPGTNPYYFVDANRDGLAQADEATRENRYASWTPRLLRAAYNLHFATMDPGAYAHNPRYMIQLLHDSLGDLGQRVAVDRAGMTRP